MEELSHEQQQAMSYEALQEHARQMMQQEPAQAAAPVAAPTPEPPAPQPEPVPASTPEPAPQPEQPKQGDPNVPLAHAREQARQAQAEAERIRSEKAEIERQAQEARQHARETQATLDKLRDELRNPDTVRAHLASIAPQAPDFDIDPQAAATHLINQQLAPLHGKIQELTQQVQAHETKARQQAAALAQHQQLQELATKHGPDFHSTLQAFDQGNPHLATLHPEVRYLAAKGLQANQATATDPAADQARIQALAEKLAEDKVAQALASGKGAKGIATLGAAPTSKSDTAIPDLASMSYDDQMRMPLHEQQEALRRSYGGG